ncbi:MAG: MerR family transcriptional regulator [Trichocoleus desertorum ATA4-8-CV12]|jgi:DNA-binding transcriptional MerR regulator|nr:MerR family transcriptional regulator [Trichocoleus desertorum ATA4-8-CV12]
MISGFTRQEALSITGITSGRLSYLDETGLVKPQRIGASKRPRVVYSVGQIIELKVISRLREKLSLQEIRTVIAFLKSRNYEQSLFNCNLIFVDAELYLIEDWESFGTMVLKASGKNKGQIVIHEIGKIGEVISDLRREAEKHQVLDFEKRIQGTPLALAN